MGRKSEESASECEEESFKTLKSENIAVIDGVAVVKESDSRIKENENVFRSQQGSKLPQFHRSNSTASTSESIISSLSADGSNTEENVHSTSLRDQKDDSTIVSVQKNVTSCPLSQSPNDQSIVTKDTASIFRSKIFVPIEDMSISSKSQHVSDLQPIHVNLKTRIPHMPLTHKHRPSLVKPDCITRDVSCETLRSADFGLLTLNPCPSAVSSSSCKSVLSRSYSLPSAQLIRSAKGMHQRKISGGSVTSDSSLVFPIVGYISDENKRKILQKGLEDNVALKFNSEEKKKPNFVKKEMKYLAKKIRRTKDQINARVELQRSTGYLA